jgi:hypothetical protein
VSSHVVFACPPPGALRVSSSFALGEEAAERSRICVNKCSSVINGGFFPREGINWEGIEWENCFLESRFGAVACEAEGYWEMVQAGAPTLF